VAVTVACSRCGATNRVDAGRIERGLQPVCGRCKASLYPASAVVETSDARFDDQVLAASLPVLLDVWAPWCVPCRGMEPIIEELAAALAGRVRVAKLNVDRSPATAARLRIQGVPTLIVFKDGHEVTRMVGARPKAEILRALTSVA
jgi:thioredoxin 2